ncbi:phage tail protein [Angustibacter luteus]|uniref:Phage tail protein n=1 Tax=Angustibacter luteus TaxID=658456 RepID=A0ABW1JDV9_9ACTN
MAIRDNPYGEFNFLVQLGDGSDDTVAGGFRTVSGIGTSLDVIEYRNGNDRSPSTRLLAGLRRHPRAVLTRGVIGDLRLWQWANQDPPERRTVTIVLLDETRSAVMAFTLLRAWPTKWEGPALDAAGTDVAIETLELCYEGLQVESI